LQDAAKKGMMEDWKKGRLEDWKKGRLEDWKIGKTNHRLLITKYRLPNEKMDDGKNGMMEYEKWKVGKTNNRLLITEWKNGKMEYWKIGIMKGWKDDASPTIALAKVGKIGRMMLRQP
jgi:hypothetical protein